MVSELLKAIHGTQGGGEAAAAAAGGVPTTLQKMLQLALLVQNSGRAPGAVGGEQGIGGVMPPPAGLEAAAGGVPAPANPLTEAGWENLMATTKAAPKASLPLEMQVHTSQGIDEEGMELVGDKEPCSTEESLGSDPKCGKDLRPIFKHPPSDQYWRKYAQKRLKGGESPSGNLVRYYYRCTVQGCPAKKTVEKEPWDTVEMAQLRFSEQHNHPITHPSQQIPNHNASSAPRVDSVMTAAPVAGLSRTPASMSSEQQFARELQAAVTCALTGICITLMWPVCQLWVPDPQHTCLTRFKCALLVREAAVQTFNEQSLGLTLSLDPTKDSVTVPSKVWHSSEPELVQDIAMPQHICPLHLLATQAGMRAGAAFPVHLDGLMIGVLAMFSSSEVRVSDADVTYLITSLTALGHALVVLLSRLSGQPPAQVKKMLPLILYHTNSICKTLQR